MSSAPLALIHRYIPAPAAGSALTLLLLHGTGGDENDLIDLGGMLSAKANLLSPRRKILENGMPRFFRRLAEGIFDQEDLKIRTHELADFVEAASRAFHFPRDRVLAVGFSNGANIAASLLLLHPGLLKGAILFRVMTPLVPQPLPDLAATSIFIAAGLHDPMVPREETARLDELFRKAGADVTLHWQAAGHEIDMEEVGLARKWLSERLYQPSAISSQPSAPSRPESPSLRSEQD
jgi:phospholipase/carboxylesterase